jgi:two-component system, NarL family, captular synthesis response regulator RcsB
MIDCMNDPAIRVVIADDHPALLVGIAHELAGVSAITVIGSATNSDELIQLLDSKMCDVLVTDYAMPGGSYGDGIALLSFIGRRYPELKLVVLTGMDNPAIIRTLVVQGTCCILSKADAASHITHAVYAAYSGKTYLSPTMSDIVRDIGEAVSVDKSMLTQREAEVVRLYVSGLTVNEIAAQLNRSKKTVSAQKQSAMKKLGIERESDLFKYALEGGLFLTASPRSSSG